MRSSILETGAALILLAAMFMHGCGDEPTATAPTVSVNGDATIFIEPPYGRIAGATVTILEQSDRHVVTGVDGHFVFDKLHVGEEVTFVMDHPDYPRIQTGTIRIGPQGAERVTFQAPDYGVYAFFEQVLRVHADPNLCQMVTTATRKGKSVYDPGSHGEAGATVTLEPPLPEENGPIYFNSSVLPDRKLEQTSADGGVIFVNVPPGEYVWTAHKDGVTFSQVKMKCHAGILVNASPPWGLQVQ